jgi:hypothetical protein
VNLNEGESGQRRLNLEESWLFIRNALYDECVQRKELEKIGQKVSEKIRRVIDKLAQRK